MRSATMVLAALMAAAPALTQTGLRAPSELMVFGERLDVRVVNVEVVVTKWGRRVEGLGKESFTLRVNGEETAIDYFDEVRDDRIVARSGVSGPEGVEAVVPSGDRPVRRILVFIDEVFLVARDRDRVLQRLDAQLDLLGPDDRLAVVACNGRGVELLSGWAAPGEALRSVLVAAQDRPTRGLQPKVLGLSRSLRAQVLDAASASMRALYTPGDRKAMLLVAGAWPSGGAVGVVDDPDVRREFEGLGHDPLQAPGGVHEGGGSDGEEESQQLLQLARSLRATEPEPDILHTGVPVRDARALIETANRLGYTLYPVDGPGMEFAYGSAEHATLSEVISASLASQFSNRRFEDGLVYLASATGGRAALNGTRGDALARIVRDTSSYYRLGFSSALPDGDHTLNLDVDVDLPGIGLRVRSRKTYSQVSRHSEVTTLVQASQLLDQPLAGEGQLSARLGAARRLGRRGVAVSLGLEFPMAGLAMEPLAEGGFVTRLDLRIVATDDLGRRAPIPVVPVEARFAQPPAEGEVGFIETEIRLRGREHALLISLHDPLSDRLLVARADFVADF